MSETIRFYRRNLPHWLVADRTYFVTLRLWGTLPVHVVEELQAERENLIKAENANETTNIELLRRQFLKVEGILDACDNETAWLREPNVAEVVMGNLDWLRGRGWRILAAVTLPNHVHVLMRNETGRTGELLEDLGQFKGYTARVANRTLGRSGGFWAREDFDHWCRTPEKVESAIRYIRENPVKAGLVVRWQEWPWLAVDPEWQKVVDEDPSPRSGGGTGGKAARS